MRSLVLLLVVTGCSVHEDDEGELGRFCGDGVVDGEEVCDDGNRVDGDGCSNSCGLPVPLSVSWVIENGAGAELTCAPHADVARIYVQAFEGATPIGAEETFRSPCVAPAGVVVAPAAADTADTYSVIVELVLAADGHVYGVSAPVRVDDSTGSLAHAVITIP